MEAIRILAKGLMDIIAANSGDRIDNCDAVGLVIQIDQIEKSYIFKYDLNTNEFGLEEIKYKSIIYNALLYYHDNEADTAVQAALHGDDIVDDNNLQI
jgi:hypothetical protein